MHAMKKLNLAVNGLGRIGRCILRAYFENIEDYQDYLNIVVVNAGTPCISDRIHSLAYDSVHGRFDKKIEILTDDTFRIDNSSIKMIFERDIAKINWRDFDIDIVLECTGSFTKNSMSHTHLDSGAKKVIVSAPYNDADTTIVLGANEELLDARHRVISIGSCTTNCLAPIAKILDTAFGIESGFMTTIHSYTNDQLILDGRHNDQRRSRAAALSMIPTSTGAAKAIGEVLPALHGKLGGAAIRVPTANVSMIDFKFTSKVDISEYAINNALSKYSNEIANIISVSDVELVSCDFNHTRYSAIFDTTLTKVVNNNFCRVVAWYDNEWGFSNRMLDVSKKFLNKVMR